VIVHESIARNFLDKLTEKAGKLRVGAPSGDVDMGAITMEKQKLVYEKQMKDAHAKGARFLAGGDYKRDQAFMPPTIVTGADIETTDIYNEETFGPVLAVTTFKSLHEAVEKTNRSKYGLLASVMTKNLSMGEQVARQLEVGTVIINDVTFTAGLAETPWGGVKESGFGRTRSEIGLYEFVNVRHIHRPISRLFVFKSWWWYPYSRYQYETFRQFAELYRRHWTDRLKAFPHVLWNLVKFLKEEPRL
jgi:acyl-CoA reductase-like NAD-dependent aldehyde dehydrogenase